MKKQPIIFFLGLIAALATPSAESAEEASRADSLMDLIERHPDTEWKGSSELWIDPMGNDAATSDATLRIQPSGLAYTWSYKGKQQTGKLVIRKTVVEWSDTWHQPESIQLEWLQSPRAIFSAEYSYPAGAGPDWHWRIQLSQRPDDTLVVQMTNITPWGEEARAVRMILTLETADS